LWALALTLEIMLLLVMLEELVEAEALISLSVLVSLFLETTAKAEVKLLDL
jgi:hypothetical protein